MPQDLLTGQLLREMLIQASQKLDQNSNQINALNIFPVPDGDTGTNMNMTLKSAVAEMQKVTNNAVGEIAEAASKGSLMGARGNSGVILSQLIRGIALGLANKVNATPVEFAKALERGVEVAYQAVMKPVEGTILTVAREAAKTAVLGAYKDNTLHSVLADGLRQGGITLDKTPDMLPVLKQAGVVDAGGKGLMEIYEGFLDALGGQTAISEGRPSPDNLTPIIMEDEVIDDIYTFCTEFLIKGKSLNSSEIKSYLQAYGNSMLVVGTEDLLKIHIHTNNPGLVLEYCLGKGTLHEIHINNMRDQAENKSENELVDEPVQNRPFGVVAVTLGDGLKEIFQSLGVDEMVSGGQTMNPSTEDLLKAVEKVPSQRVFLLPNNKNILLAAQQVPNLTQKEVKIIPTKNIPQGISAMLSYETGSHFAVNEEKMLQNIDQVLTGEVTEAARDSNYKDFNIKQGNIIGINEDEITVVGDSIRKVTRDLIENMLGNSRELVTLYYGNNTEKEEADKFLEELADEFPEIEFELHYGGQPHYFYIISVE